MIQRLEELHEMDLKNYYYEFDAPIPGWDHPGTFHSVDLWFSFETLAKCWRPFTGMHYDLARQMCNYWTNFVKSGNPNGLDSTGEPMPEWNPFTSTQPNQMLFAKKAEERLCEPSNVMQSLIYDYEYRLLYSSDKK